MTNESKLYQITYKMQKDIAVIKEHMKAINGSIEKHAERIQNNEIKIQKANVNSAKNFAKWGGIGFGILIAMQILQFSITIIKL